MTDPGPLSECHKARMNYIGQITKQGHPHDGWHLYQCPEEGCEVMEALEEKYTPGKGRYTCPHGTAWREEEAGPPINDYYYALQGERKPGCECLPPDER